MLDPDEEELLGILTLLGTKLPPQPYTRYAYTLKLHEVRYEVGQWTSKKYFLICVSDITTLLHDHTASNVLNKLKEIINETK